MRWFCAIPPLAAACAAQAQPGAAPAAPEPEASRAAFTSFALYWENDGGLLAKPFHPSDKHYTNGLKADFGFQSRDIDRWASALPSPLGAPEAGNDGFRAGAGFGITQLIFTPTDLEATEPIPDDQPYAGYLGVNLFLQRADRWNLEQFELDIGLVGEYSLAEATQKQVHAAIPDQIDPQGWDNQLSHELIINFNYRRRWRHDPLALGALGFQAIPQVGFDVGNMRISANADLLARVGWNLPNDFGPARIADLRDISGSWTGASDWGFYLYGRAGGQAIARDIFLDGNTFADSLSVTREPFVGELQAGLVARWRMIELGYAVTWTSEQFEEQEDPHAFGAWTLSAHWAF
ncbi:MAG: lipid A deacylase LpxR family protein [Phycisphaerales bacterium JB039]